MFVVFFFLPFHSEDELLGCYNRILLEFFDLITKDCHSIVIDKWISIPWICVNFAFVFWMDKFLAKLFSPVDCVVVVVVFEWICIHSCVCSYQVTWAMDSCCQCLSCLDCVLAIIMLSFPHIAKHQFLKPPFSAHFMDSQSGLVSFCKIIKWFEELVRGFVEQDSSTWQGGLILCSVWTRCTLIRKFSWQL